ncbi:MAG: Ig-like domain-containing protein, partial [Flavobacteriales bacterium]|nr:Ig-like domain-containing protein [Flavobacteriales bacterium]
DITLWPIYIGTETATPYTFSSSNTSVASVTSSGVVSFNGSGSCDITVVASGLDGSPAVVVPVMVLGAPPITPPITKVVVSPDISDIFKGETVTYTAKAYNSSGTEMTGAAFTWTTEDATIATISASGVVTATGIGSAKVYATTQGIVGQGEVVVNPSTFIQLAPMLANIPASGTKQFTATTYDVTKDGNDNFVLTPIANPSDLTWEVPAYGIPAFDIATVNTTGLVTVKSSAIVGSSGFVIAYSPSDLDISPGVGTIMVSLCDCGVGTGVTSITTDQSVYNLSMFSGGIGQINTTTIPSGQVVSYCSDDDMVVNVDDFGELVGIAPGTATVTVCNGTVETSVTVNVTF